MSSTCTRKSGDAPDGRGMTAMFARDLNEVRDEWERMSGQKLSRARVWQILVRAEEKLKEQLAPEFSQYVSSVRR